MRYAQLMASCAAVALMSDDGTTGQTTAVKSPDEIKAEAAAADAAAVTADQQRDTDAAAAIVADAQSSADAASASQADAAAAAANAIAAAADAQRDASASADSAARAQASASAAAATAAELTAHIADAAAAAIEAGGDGSVPVNPNPNPDDEPMFDLVAMLVAMDTRARVAGHSLSDILVKAAQNEFGIDVSEPSPAPIADPGPLTTSAGLSPAVSAKRDTLV